MRVITFLYVSAWGFWWLSGKEATCHCGKCRFDPWVRKIPWRRKCNPLQYSCLNIHEHRSLVGYSLWGHKVGYNLSTKRCKNVCLFNSWTSNKLFLIEFVFSSLTALDSPVKELVFIIRFTFGSQKNLCCWHQAGTSEFLTFWTSVFCFQIL